MEKTLENKQVINGKYEVQFFLDGTDVYEKYRVKGIDNKTYLLKLYNSSKLSRYSFTNEGLLETEILRQIDHINIISLVESGEVVENSQKYHFLIFDFISGETLYEKLKREGVFSPYSAVPMTLNILNAVDELHNHSKTIIHNNINMNNISLDYSKNSEKPVLTGFNFARYIDSKSNSVDIEQLSPFSIAPELYNGVFTPQSDVFSIGVLLYQMIFGIPPWYLELPEYQYSDDKFKTLLFDKRNEDLSFIMPDFEVLDDEHLKETMVKALSIDVENRFKNIEEFNEALSRQVILAGGSTKKTKQVSTKAEVKQGDGFSAIAGMEELKTLLYNDVIRALNEQELYESYGVSIPNGMLLYGPPGCGKTFISERFAEEVGFNFVQLKPSDIKSKYINATEENIGKIFKDAIDKAPSIIFIDEMDAVVPSREDSDLHHMHASAVNELLAQMSNCSEKGIFIIAASNRPEKIDPAMLRTGRLDKIIYLPPPDYEARKAMFELYLKDRPIDIGLDYEPLAKLTNNFVSSDIKFIVDEASRFALKKKERITKEIVINTIKNLQPSVSYKELKKYEILRDEFEDKKGGKKKDNKPSIGFTNTNQGKVMEKDEFKKLLFKVAFCTMVCDGHIDEREIDEIKMMDKNTSFFYDIDLSEELSELISELGKKGTQIINDLFKTLKNNILNPIQELIILEVALRIINADHKHDENEIKFIHFLRAKLKLHDEEIVDRFGEIDILHTSSYIKNVVKGQNNKDFTKNLRLPKINEIKKIKFNLE